MFSENNIPKEYIELISEDLVKFQNELTLLSEHRKDVESILNKFTDENGQTKVFPPEGLTAEDEVWLRSELASIDRDVASLTKMIANIKSKTENALKDDLGKIAKDFEADNKAQTLQAAILNTLMEYTRWQEGVITPSEKEVREDDGKGPSGKDSIQSNVDYTDESLWSDNGLENNNTPSLLDIAFLKTAGNHTAALDNYNSYQEILEERDLTASEQMHLEHIMSQMRFFRASENLTDWSKKSGNRLMIVHRNNIPAEMQDKIIFFDSNKGDVDYSKKFVFLKDLNKVTTTENENIKLVLVDSKLEPVLVDGKNSLYRYAYCRINYS